VNLLRESEKVQNPTSMAAKEQRNAHKVLA
jgi:hypothetical protein